LIQLMRYRVEEDGEILYNRPFTPQSLAEDFEIKDGKWYVDNDGWLVGENPNNTAAMVMSRGSYCGDVLVEFDASTVTPATRDINVTWHGSWDEEKNCRGTAYVAGIQGWWQGLVGFEKSPDYKLVAATKLFPFEAGRVYHVAVGNVGRMLFIAIDGVLALEIHDPDPIDTSVHGRVGFEAYCTRVRYSNLCIRRMHATDVAKPYEPEF